MALASSLMRRVIRRHTHLLNHGKGIPTTGHPLLAAHLSTSLPDLRQTPSLQQAQEERRWKWSNLFLFVPGAITFGLGTWQLFRRQEKVEVIDYRKKRLEMEPMNLNSLSSVVDLELGSMGFRRVECEGVFDESKSVFIGPRSRTISGVTENGYYILTPMTLMTGESNSVQLPVVVNRGWVPQSWRNKSLADSKEKRKLLDNELREESKERGNPWWKFWSKQPPDSKAEEPNPKSIKIVGVIRGSENPSIFVPANDPDSGQWFYVDVPAIARFMGLPENTVYIEDIRENVDANNPYPIPKDVKTLIHHSVMPRDHLNYALTWYSLSAAVTFMAAKRTMPKKKLR